MHEHEIERERQRQRKRERERKDEHVNVQQANKCVYVSNRDQKAISYH